MCRFRFDDEGNLADAPAEWTVDGAINIGGWSAPASHKKVLPLAILIRRCYPYLYKMVSPLSI